MVQVLGLLCDIFVHENTDHRKMMEDWENVGDVCKMLHTYLGPRGLVHKIWKVAEAFSHYAPALMAPEFAGQHPSEDVLRLWLGWIHGPVDGPMPSESRMPIKVLADNCPFNLPLLEDVRVCLASFRHLRLEIETKNL